MKWIVNSSKFKEPGQLRLFISFIILYLLPDPISCIYTSLDPSLALFPGLSLSQFLKSAYNFDSGQSRELPEISKTGVYLIPEVIFFYIVTLLE